MSGSELKQREIQEEGMRRRREGETRRERERDRIEQRVPGVVGI